MSLQIKIKAGKKKPLVELSGSFCVAPSHRFTRSFSGRFNFKHICYTHESVSPNTKKWSFFFASKALRFWRISTSKTNGDIIIRFQRGHLGFLCLYVEILFMEFEWNKVKAKASSRSTSRPWIWVKILLHTHPTPAQTPVAEQRGGRSCHCSPNAPPNQIVVQRWKSRHFGIYCWINWHLWEQLTGHSSWRALAQWRPPTGLLCFDFLSRLPW